MNFEIPNLLPLGIDQVLVEEQRDARLRNISMNAMKAYLRTRSIGSFHVDSYEESIDNICEKVENIQIPIGDSGYSIRFKKVELKKPSNTPIACQMRSLHYVGKLVGNAVFVDTEGKEFGKPEQVVICELPVMVRSKYCLLNEIYQRYETLTDNLVSLRSENPESPEMEGLLESLREVGEEMKNIGADPADPGKYFILDGIPRIILMTEKLRLNVPYVYMEAGNTVLSLSAWSPRPIPSILKITSENIHKKNDEEDMFSQIKLNNSMFDSSGKSMIDIFHVFRMLGLETEEDVIRILERIYPTFDDPKRISVFHSILAFCSPSLKTSFPDTDKSDAFLNVIISTAFKKNIPNVYPKNESENLDEENGSKAWAQRILCMNLMPYMKLAGEDGGNINWYDETDDFIKVYSKENTRKVHARIYNLSILLMRYCLVRLGELPASNRDSWENKRLVTSGERFTTQFHWSFIRTTVPDKTSKEFSTTIQEGLKSVYEKNKSDLVDYIKGNKISAYDLLQIVKIGGVVPGCEPNIEGEAATVIRSRYTKADVSLTCAHDPSVIIPVILEDYWNAFKRRGWGIRGKNSYWEKDVTDTLNMNQSDLHTYNQLCQIVVRTNDQSKNIQPRMVQESQFGFVCPVVSPEGENIGNTKQIAIGTVVSKIHLKQTDLDLFVGLLAREGAPRWIRSWVSEGEDMKNYSRLIYNGCFVGLCEAMEMKNYLIEMRARNRFFRDACIFVDEMFQVVVTTDGSRLLRPVFRLNQETGVPMFLEDQEDGFAQKKYLTSVDYQKMEARGYIDYIDACEQLAGFYYTKFGTPLFIKSARDVPSEERSLEKMFKPFPTGLLIADSIWDIFSMRDRAKLAMNKIKGLSAIQRFVGGRSVTAYYQKLIRDSVVNIAFAAMSSKEELENADKWLNEVSVWMFKTIGMNPEEEIGQGRRMKNIFVDSMKAMVIAKLAARNNTKTIGRNMETKTAMDLMDEFVTEEIANNRKMLLDLTIQSRYTHASIHPAMMYSAVALDIPYLSHIHGPRANLASKFNQQPLRGRHMNHDVLMPGEVKVLETPEVPLVVTSTSGMTGMAHHPTGQNVIVAVACFDGENQEDALIFNRQSIEQGMFSYSRYYTEVLSNDSDELNMFGTEMYHKSASKRSNIRFGLNDAIHSSMNRYRHISRKGGLPKPGIFLNPRDCIIAAYENDEIDRSVYVKEDGAGYVDRVTVTRNFAGNPVVKVRIRQVLQPIVGDKFASRHAQKATIGRIANAEDMPYVKETGLRPDIIINPHCLTGDTLVSMSGGVSKRIDSLADETNVEEEVWGWNGEDLELKQHLGLEYKGKRKVYRLTLTDGRTIKTTSDHRFLTSLGEWVQAKDLSIGEADLSMGLELPEDKKCDLENEWTMEFGDDVLEMNTITGRNKTLALARILGNILSDGCIARDKRYEDSFRGYLCLGHDIDVKDAIRDLNVFGIASKIRFSGNVYYIDLPARFAKTLSKLSGIVVGNNSIQEQTLPVFLTEDRVPLSVLREFVGSLFGGDGWAPYMVKDKLYDVAFSQSVKYAYTDSLKNKMTVIGEMLRKLGVNKWRITNLKQTVNNGVLTCSLVVSDSYSFGKFVGFRYCIQKASRLTAAMAYWRYIENVKRQSNWMLKNVSELFDSGKEKTLQDALDKCRRELQDTEPVLNKFYSLSNITMLHNRRKPSGNNEIKSLNYRHIDSAKAFFERHGCYDWFKSSSGGKADYVVKRGSNVPTFNMRVIDRRCVGEEDVYDIGVRDVESFCANGIIVHNCLPSRQTVGQVLEMVAAKAALLKGERVVADVYQKPDVDNIIKTLRQYNYDETGKEILTDPKTGLPFSTKVLIGPCYYQALKHQVKFKMQSREGVGATDNITGQPVGGRQIKGGTRQGTMESAILTMADTMAYHQCMVADAYPTKVCGTCGMVTAPQSSCVAITCKFCSSVSATRLTTLLEEIEMNGMEKFHQILLENFRDSEKIKSDPQVREAREIVDSLENVTDSIPEALFPRAKIFEDKVANEVTKTALRTYWRTMVEVGTGLGIYKDKVSSSVIRPIIDEDWKTVVIPQSSLVFFRYMSQVGFNAKFKFDPEKMSVLEKTKENQIKATIQSKKDEPIQNVFAFARKTFPDVNFAKGTPAWYLVHQIAKK